MTDEGVPSRPESETAVQAPTVGLLVFSRNDLDSALQLLRASKPHVDELVLLDSSDPAVIEAHRALLAEIGVRVVRALPTGYIDVLRPFGASQMRSDWILQLDTDETLRPELWAELRNLARAPVGGYVLPRHEASLGAISRHLRLYRRDGLAWPSASYGYPNVRGPVVELRPPLAIEHASDHAKYLDEGRRATRYLWIESYERPLDGQYLWDTLVLTRNGTEVRPPGLGWLASDRGRTLSGPAARLTLFAEAVRHTATDRSFASARFHYRYGLARWRFDRSTDPAERERQREIRTAIRHAGGLVRFLGFDDPEYVRALTASFPWDRDGNGVLRTLLAARRTTGRPMEGAWPRAGSAS